MHINTVTSNISVNGEIEFLKITTFNFTAVPNLHPTLNIEGYVAKDVALKLKNKQIKNKNCSIMDIESGSVIFSGIYENITLEHQDEVVVAKATIVSGTKLLDYEEKSQSYQDTNATFEQVVTEVLADSTDAVVIFNEEASAPIGIPLLQYNETNWEFIKRIASMQNLSLFCDYHSPLPRFSFGLGKSKKVSIINDKYELELSKKYYEDGGEETGRYKADYLVYKTGDSQNISLGNKVGFMGQDLIVCKQTCEFSKGEIKYFYTLGHVGYTSQQTITNLEVQKVSLAGNVVETNGETVKIALDIDDNNIIKAQYPFKWTPITGNVMYCMPKVNTRARVNFKGNESFSYTSPRTNGETCGEFSVPAKKCFVTEHGKRLNMYPNSMEFTSIPSLQIKLHQIMLFKSHNKIEMIASGTINIQAPRIVLDSPQQIISNCTNQSKTNPPTGGGNSSFVMDYQFDMLGEQGILCATESIGYLPFDDAPSDFDRGGWLANLVMGAVAVVVFVGLAFATGGTSVIAAGICMGVAMGAAVATATISIEDSNDGSVRSFNAAMEQVAFGAIVGGTTGALSALIAPLGVATLSTHAGIGLFAGMGGRLIAGNTSEYMDFNDTVNSMVDPVSMGIDAVTGGLLGGIFNKVLLGTANPSSQAVSLYSNRQAMARGVTTATESVSGGGNTRQFRKSNEFDSKNIADIKLKYGAGKGKNAAAAKGNIGGDEINLESISGKPKVPGKKGNFTEPEPANYHYQGIDDSIYHTEQKTVEYLRVQYKDTPLINGSIEIISEREFCDNCKILVDMFQKEFPNIKVVRVEVMKQ